MPPYVLMAVERFTIYNAGLLMGMSLAAGLNWLSWAGLGLTLAWLFVIRPARRRMLESHGVPQ